MDLSTYLKQERGRAVALALKLDVPAPLVSQWSTGARPVPVERAPAIELATLGVVMRWDLRPHDWHLMWPELMDREDAPPVSIDADTCAGGDASSADTVTSTFDARCRTLPEKAA